MTRHPLTLTYVADPASGLVVPDDAYWLTIEQVVEEQAITAGEAAEMIDALFDLTPCVDTEETGTEPETEPPADAAAMVDKIAEEVPIDLSACERAMLGTYTTQLKVVRSNPAEPYTLRLSVGEVKETVLVESQVVESLDINFAASVRLTMPVQGNLRCSWQGQTISRSGAVTPPTIKAVGSTLYWDGEVTGTIRAEYDSIYDLVTVEIPGLPDSPGSDRGEPQDSMALAFYHGQVYLADITPPPTDRDELLAQVCGWGAGGSTWEDEEDPEAPEPPPPPEPVYGCIDYYPLAPFGSPVTEPWFYEQTCCVPGSHDGCRVRSSRREGGKGLSAEKIAQMTAEWPGPIEFIGLGPITPEGCGTRYEQTRILRQNCCDEVEPMAWDAETSVEVLAPGTSGLVGVTGGAPPYHWSIRGNGFAFSADGRLRDGVSDAPYIYVYALATACGWAPITVYDGCSEVSDGVKSTQGSWEYIGGLIPYYYYMSLWPELYESAWNDTQYMLGVLVEQRKNQYVMCYGIPGQYPLAEWGARGGTLKSPAGGHGGSYVTDPYVGVFSWLGIVSDTIIYENDPAVGYGVVTAMIGLTNAELSFYKWVC